jgi:hypothetical protein
MRRSHRRVPTSLGHILITKHRAMTGNANDHRSGALRVRLTEMRGDAFDRMMKRGSVETSQLPGEPGTTSS